MQSLAPAEIESYEWLAQQGEVERFLKTKKGRTCVIFKMLAPELPPVEPSLSAVSSCSLTDNDMQGFAGLLPRTRCQVERWMGWGLISETR